MGTRGHMHASGGPEMCTRGHMHRFSWCTLERMYAMRHTSEHTCTVFCPLSTPRSNLRATVEERKRKAGFGAGTRLDDGLPRSDLPAALFRAIRANGVAKLSGRQLIVFPPELLDPAKYLDEGEKAWEITLPEKVDLGDNQITELPDGVGGGNAAFCALKHLELRNNLLVGLPADLWNLPELAFLGLAGNELASLGPGPVGGLARLRELDLSRSQLEGLPESLGQLGGLAKLRLGQSPRLKRLPDSLGQLARLGALHADHCALEALPDSIGGCTSLTLLDCSFNALSTVPDGTGDLASLTILNLANNQITHTPRVPAGASFTQLFLRCSARCGRGGVSILSCHWAAVAVAVPPSSTCFFLAWPDLPFGFGF